MIKPKPCPFCGRYARLQPIYFDTFTQFYVRCETCFCRTDIYNRKEVAIERWNRRVGDE